MRRRKKCGKNLREAEHRLWLGQQEASTVKDIDPEATKEQPEPIGVQATRPGTKWLITGLAVLALLAVMALMIVIKISDSASSQANANQNQVASNNFNASESPSLSPVPSPTPDEAQFQQAMNRYLAGVAKVSNGDEEDKSLRKVVHGDIDGDGDNDAVVQFVVVPNAGNNSGVFLAVFINKDGKFKGVTDEVVGGNHLRDFELESVQPGRIVAVTLECSGDDYPCENEMKRQAIILWKNNKLILPGHWIQ